MSLVLNFSHVKKLSWYTPVFQIMYHDSLASQETNLGSEEEGIKIGQSQFLPLLLGWRLQRNF